MQDTQEDVHQAPALSGSEIWDELRAEAEQTIAREEALRGVLEATVLFQTNFAAGLGSLLAGKLAHSFMPAATLAQLANAAMTERPAIIAEAAADLAAIRARDPAAESYLTPF
ncbi:MAG: serine O-acetyltransferase, partial [Alphaproteobacteria bacterium]|nr:serine O-acetyltransferase [Alphaproteobacteria bacterium]